MIFVTVGTDNHQFNRLLIAIDELIENSFIKEEVFAQIGNSDYFPKNYKFSKFLDSEEWEKKITDSSLVISHSGAGSIMTTLVNKKPIIIVPRLKRFDEHVNDHQIDIAKELEKEGKIIVVYQIEKLKDSIIKARRKKSSKQKRNNKIVEIIDHYVKGLIEK